MQRLKRFISVVLAAVFVFLLTACKSGDAHIYFELVTPPENLDPQTAFSDSELLIVRNIFEGLLRRDKDGKIVKGACCSYSKNGNEYSFTLREGIKWSNGKPVTAEDFIFGFRRAVSPNTASPFASRLFSVENAREINAGNMDVSSLGISGGGNSLKIRLSEEDADFEDTLASSVCMPCNEDFFIKSEGKYGQESDGILSNGSYRLSKWNREEFGVRLYKFEDYNGDFKAKNGAVFFSCTKKGTKTERLLKDACDLAFLPSGELESAQKQFSVKSIENKCWVMTVSGNYENSVRTALLSAFSPTVYGDSLPAGYRAATSLYPEILSVQGAENAGVTPYDLETARRLFSSAVSKMKDKKFPSATLYYYNAPELKEAITAAVGHWQQNLSAFVNIEASKNLTALEKELKTRTLDFAVFPVAARSGAVKNYLELFFENGSPVSAQENLLKDKTLVPFAFESTNIAYSGNVENVYFDVGNGYIDFSFIEKSE